MAVFVRRSAAQQNGEKGRSRRRKNSKKLLIRLSRKISNISRRKDGRGLGKRRYSWERKGKSKIGLITED